MEIPSESESDRSMCSQQFPRNPNPETAAEQILPQTRNPNQNSTILTHGTNLDEDPLDVSMNSLTARTDAGEIDSARTVNSEHTTEQEQEAPVEGQDEEIGEGAVGGPALPGHLSHLSVEEREALQRRMTREMAIDEARNSEPRRRIDRNAKQLYSSAVGTSTFLILLVLKIQENVSISWGLVFIPLCCQYFILFCFSLLDIYDGYKSWLLQRQAGPSDGILAGKRVLARAQETLWHVTCGTTAPLLAQHLSTGSPSIIRVFIPVWVYGGVALLLGLSFISYGLYSKCAHESCVRVFSSLNTTSFALFVRVLPVLLVVNKILGADYSWAVVFVPLWISVGVLAVLGCCVCCVVPVLVLTQEAAGRVLGWIVGIAAAMMVVPAACSLTFLALLVEHLESKGDKPPLLAVVSPLIVMNILLAILTPLLVKVVNSTNNVLDAMQNTGPTVEGEPSTGGKRPGVERTLTDIKPEMVFRQQTSTLFKRVVSDVVNTESNFTVSGDTKCYVCCERQRDSVLQPCGHGGLCYECAVEVLQMPSLGRAADSMPKCPLCRANVHEVLKLSGVAGTTTEFVAKTSWSILGNLRDSTETVLPTSGDGPDLENGSSNGFGSLVAPPVPLFPH